METTAAQEEANSSPEREQWCWQDPPDGDLDAPGNPAHGKGTPGLPVPRAGAPAAPELWAWGKAKQPSCLQVTRAWTEGH